MANNTERSEKKKRAREVSAEHNALCCIYFYFPKGVQQITTEGKKKKALGKAKSLDRRWLSITEWNGFAFTSREDSSPPAWSASCKQPHTLKARCREEREEESEDPHHVSSRQGLPRGAWALKSCAKSTSVERWKVGLKIREKEPKHFRKGRPQDQETKRGR